MFYLDISKMEKTLRFGDVIRNFPICFSVIENPLPDKSYKIQINAPTFSVVLSPCCSIKDKMISVAPLVELPKNFFSNPFIAEDPKRINIKIPAINSLPPAAWENMDPSEKATRLSKEDAYVHLHYFVYDSHDLFNEYTIYCKNGNFKSRAYLIDFRTSVYIRCDKIVDHQALPISVKVLQLTIDTRDLLRKKIVSFYQRIPEEDANILVS